MKKILPLILFILLITLTPAYCDIPTTPTGLSMVATSSTITVSWTANTDKVTSGYYIYFYKSSDTASVTRVTFPIPTTTASTYSKILAGLDNNTQYTVQLSAYGSSGESAYVSGTITTSTVSLDINLVSQGALQVAVENTSADFAYYDLYIGTSSVPVVSGNRDLTQYKVLSQTWINISTPYIEYGLSNGTYYILVQVRNSSGTIIFTSDEESFVVEDFKTLFSDSGNVKSGCFVESTDQGSGFGAWRFVLPFLLIPIIVLPGHRLRQIACAFLAVVFISSLAIAEETTSGHQNIMGLKFGYLLPTEKIQKDIYGSITPVSIFYERMFGKHLSADISAGYVHCKGFAVTASSSTQTGVDATLDFIPVSMSVNFNHVINPLITLYAGAGGDTWFFEEKSFYGKSNRYVPGVHGKAGVKLLTEDPDYFQKFGIQIETSYSVIDRFGANKADLGGWMFSAGVIYSF